MALLIRIVEEAGGEERALSFEAPAVRIGRNKANEIVLDKAFVSQRHAQIERRNNSVFVIDLGSTNGTTVNGQRLQQRVPVQLSSPKDVVQIGTVRISIDIGDHVEPKTSSDEPASVERRSLRVRINDASGAELRSSTFASSPVRIGRNTLNEIVLEQPFVSQWHALVRFRGDDIWVMDLGSTNGTIVDGTRLEARTPTKLHSTDDVVQIGSITIKFSFMTPVTVAARAPSMPGADAEETALFFDALGWLTRLRGDLSPEERSSIQVGPSMDRVSELLKTFSRSYIELRNGFEQFGKEMGLNVATDSTPLHDAKSAQEVLDYLLAWEGGDERIVELKRAYTDLALHQVALLNGVMAGVRELLNELNPSGGWRPFRTSDIEKKRQEMLEEDRFSRVVFGKAFARAYFEVTGGKVEGEK